MWTLHAGTGSGSGSGGGPWMLDAILRSADQSPYIRYRIECLLVPLPFELKPGDIGEQLTLKTLMSCLHPASDIDRGAAKASMIGSFPDEI